MIAIKIMIENTLDAVDQVPIIESLIEFVLMENEKKQLQKMIKTWRFRK